MSHIHTESSEVLLSAQGLSVRFGGVLAVNDVSFDVRRGEVFTLIGPNVEGFIKTVTQRGRLRVEKVAVVEGPLPRDVLLLTRI